MTAQFWQGIIDGIRRKLREWGDLLDTPILPDAGLVPVPVRPGVRRR